METYWGWGGGGIKIEQSAVILEMKKILYKTLT